MNFYDADDTERLQLDRIYYTKQDAIEFSISGKISIQILKYQLELDQDREAEHYKILLPPCSLVLFGNLPKQLLHNRLMARFPKHAHADFINIEFVPPDVRKKIEENS